MFNQLINWLNNASTKAQAESGSLRTLSAREVHAIAGGQTISYGALQKNSASTSKKSTNKSSSQANSYNRGCSASQQCRS